MHAAGHQIVPGSLWGALDQGGRLDLQETLVGQECPGQGGNTASHHHVALQIRAAQIQETVFEAQLLLGLAVLLDGERRSLGLGEHAHGLGAHLNGAGGQIRVHRAGARLHPARHRDHELAAQLLRLGEVLSAAVALLKYNLQNAGTVPQIHKNDPALISALLNPSHHSHVLTDVGGGHLCTSVGPLDPNH